MPFIITTSREGRMQTLISSEFIADLAEFADFVEGFKEAFM